MINPDIIIRVFVDLVIVGLIFTVFFWALREMALPEPFNKVVRVLLVLLAVLILIGVLLAFRGYPMHYY